jgi:hypothetical protein
MTITRTQAAMLIELQAMIAWDDVPIVSSSVGASAELVFPDKLTDAVGVIAVDETRAVEAKEVGIGEGRESGEGGGEEEEE